MRLRALLRDLFLKKTREKVQEETPVKRGCLKNCCSKQMLWRVYKHIGNVEDYTNYKETLNIATTEIRISKRTFEKKLAGNIKKYSQSFYAYERGKQKVRDKVGPLENSSGNLISDGFQMAEVLNEYFSSVYLPQKTSAHFQFQLILRSINQIIWGSYL